MKNPSSYLLAKLKDTIWPIEKDEVKLFLPMALMMFCILLNFGALRSIKDSLVVPAIGAEAISFLKLWFVLPSSVIFTIAYVKLSNLLNIEHIFYLILTVFLIFFVTFAYIIYPNQSFYHPEPDLIKALALQNPNFQWFIKIAGRWSDALMYIFSELWSAVIINLMFWQFANHIFDSSKAKRFYPILGMIGNMGLIMAGNILIFFSQPQLGGGNLLATEAQKNLQCQEMLQSIVIIILFSGLLAMGLFRFINSHVLKTSALQNKGDLDTAASKTKLTIKESFQLIIKSKYIGHILLLILCYGLIINILEGPWKAKVKDLYPSTIDYVNFMGRFNIWMGVFSVIFMIIGSNILRKVSWLVSALLTPVMIAITGMIFFICVIFADYISLINNNLNPLYMAVMIGAIQNILSKSTKYSLFDSTKEMTYIPLPLELKTKGKATVEVVGAKLGKSLGAFTQSAIFMLLPNSDFDSLPPYLMIIFTVVIIIWFWNITKLNQEYLKLSNENSKKAGI